MSGWLSRFFHGRSLSRSKVEGVAPDKTQILVIGGGPGGSYAAGVLAREGFDVVLLESTKHPRYHIGESLLPSVVPHLRFFGVEDQIRNHGFQVKPGAVAHLLLGYPPAYNNFTEISKENGSWNVERAEFDNILLRQAAKLGAKVYEDVKVTELHFDSKDSSKPVAASYVVKEGTATRKISFDYLIDASGRAGIMSTRYLKNRKFLESLKNLATWAYFEGCNKYEPGTDRDNAPYFEALTDRTGWVWFIPLQKGKVSVGIVHKETAYKEMKKASASTEEYYDEMLKKAPFITALIGTGKRIATEPVRVASDFSYDCDLKAGPNWRLVGDAACFIDPLFSSGVHLAMTGGLSAAASICAAIRKNCSVEEAAKYHSMKVSIAFTRFLLVVLGVYKQVEQKSIVNVGDINENVFQVSIDLIRPVINGNTDVRNKELEAIEIVSSTPATMEEEISKAIDFSFGTFARHGWTQAFKEVSVDKMGVSDKGIDLQRNEDEFMKKYYESNGIEGKDLTKAERQAMGFLAESMRNFVQESIEGLTLKLETGNLGLRPITGLA
ncbi:FAD/NAD(P)-binding domain-containing protein [Atractiella rhizophila]|nr:FAD/NAD(P)-binding domain-containing protein [Atractiella rhizophila]